MSRSYSQAITWHDGDAIHAVEASGFKTRREAFAAALEDARASGWTPPRWWQFWRWSDTDYSKSEFCNAA